MVAGRPPINRNMPPDDKRHAKTAMAANLAAGRPHLAFVNSASRGAIETLDRAALAVNYTPSTPYPNNGFALALRTVAGAIVRGVGSRVYWVQTGGFDTHAQQGATGGGAYANLMGSLGDGLGAFYNDIRNQGLANDTTVIVFSEFGRRISENGSGGTDHGAAGVMMVLGGAGRGGLYGTAPLLAPGNPTLENASGDVHFETDFRAVYARMLDQWLGVAIDKRVTVMGEDDIEIIVADQMHHHVDLAGGECGDESRELLVCEAGLTPEMRGKTAPQFHVESDEVESD